MTSLSAIEQEAQRLVGALPERRRSALQISLVELCEAHWDELRGARPAGVLAQCLWALCPPLADLLLDLHAAGDWRLDGLLPGQNLAKGMALLVLAEIARGNEFGAHLAHEPMMAFQSAPPRADWLTRSAALLRGTLAPPPLRAHDHHPPLWKALALIAAHTQRLDLPAALAVIRLLAADQDGVASDAALAALQGEVRKVGIRFLGIDQDHVRFEQHGHAHDPVRARQLGVMLREIRQTWLG